MNKKKYEYQIWLLGYTAEGDATEYAHYFSRHDTPEQAINTFGVVDFESLIKQYSIPDDVKRITARVEKVNTKDSWCDVCEDVLKEKEFLLK